MNGQLKVTGAHIDYVLAELLGEKPSDYLILCLDGKPLEGFGSPPNTPHNRKEWARMVAKLNTDEVFWFKFFCRWAAPIASQFGTAQAKEFRAAASYEVHRVVVGYSQHLHAAIQLFVHLKVRQVTESWSVESSRNGAVACEIRTKSGGRVRFSGSTNPPATEQSASLPEVIVWAVIEVLRDERRNAQEGGR